MQKCEAEGPCRPVDELLDRPVGRVLEYRTYLGDLLECARKAGADTNDIEVLQFDYSHLIKGSTIHFVARLLKTCQSKKQVPV